MYIKQKVNEKPKFPHERILHNIEANIQEVKRKFYREGKQREVANSR
jgi:hypothetical protein